MINDDNVQVILYRLELMEKTLEQIHTEVKRTNGRVTELEMVNAAYDGELKAKYVQRVVFTTVLSGALLAGIVWFIQAAI
jgi:hypothetical protein